MAQHGGKRPGSGRKPGAPVSKTRADAERLLTSDGLTPLDYMVGVMRETLAFDPVRFEAAKAAAPYMHARLAAVEVNATIKRDADDLSDAELALIARGSRKPALEAPASTGGTDRVH